MRAKKNIGQKNILFSTACIFLCMQSVLADNEAKSPLKQVSIHLFEALAPRDTTSSQAFQNEFESTVGIAKQLTREKLAQCGYQLETSNFLYKASDSLQAFERSKEAEKAGAWMMIGPRRSNHYLMVAKGAPEVPSVSIMASSQEIEQLGPLHLSIYPSNRVLAKAAASETLRLSKSIVGTYYTVLSEDCLMCKDFSINYDESAKRLGLKKLGQSAVTGETPEVHAILTDIGDSKPKFVLLPNYSQVSAFLMGTIHQRFPEIIFIGGDGWGDQKFGFVERNPYVEATSGVTVRGFPPVELGLQKFPLGVQAIQLSRGRKLVPSSGPGLGLLRIFQGITDLLCEARPADKQGFKRAFEKLGASKFSSPWGVNLYLVKNGSIRYWKSELVGAKGNE